MYTVQPARRISAASTKSWLRMWPPSGGLAAQVRQAAMGREGLRADDGVVAPVIAVTAHPGREAGRDDRPVDPRRELLHPGEQGVAVDDQRQGLDDAGVGVGLHGGGEPHDGVAAHQAVGVEHDHMLVGAAPAGHEVGDVAGLAVMVLGPVPVEEAASGPRRSRSARKARSSAIQASGSVESERMK